MSKLIVIEGVDGVGKSSVVNELRAYLNGAIVSSPFSRANIFERFINEYPCSFLFYLQIIFKTWSSIIFTKVSGRDVISDRYVETVDTFSPDNEYLHNRFFRLILSFLFPRPDFYVWLKADVSMIRLRLIELAKYEPKKNCKFHNKLIENPEFLMERQEDYAKVFSSHRGLKICIDTGHKEAKMVASEIISFIKENAS